MYLQSKAGFLFRKLEEDRPLLGTILTTNSPRIAEILAYVGFDWLLVDQMFSDIDWSGLAEIVRSAQGSDMVIIARLENDPWHGAGDVGISARAARAIGVGCDGVRVSVSGLDQAEAILAAGGGWHRNLHITPFVDNQEFEANAAERESEALVIPGVESRRGLEDVEAILDLPKLRMFGLGMTDVSAALGYPMQYEHPEVWRLVDRTVEYAKSRNVALMCGTGYAYRSWDEIAGRVGRMHKHGIKAILLQTPEFLFQVAATDLLKRIRQAV